MMGYPPVMMPGGGWVPPEMMMPPPSGSFEGHVEMGGEGMPMDGSSRTGQEGMGGESSQYLYQDHPEHGHGGQE
jgi:hypothetical protein